MQTLINLWYHYRGIPIWTIDHDGDVRKSRLWIVQDNVHIINKLYGQIIANPDGTVDNSYVARWLYR